MYSEEIEVDIPLGGPAYGTLNWTGEGDTPVCVTIPGHYRDKDGKKYTSITAELERKNIATLRFDPYYPKGEKDADHFLSEDGVFNIACAVRHLKSLGYKDIGIMGSSTGANLALEYAAQYQDAKALVLRAPTITFLDLLHLNNVYSPVLFICGSKDVLFPLERAEEAMKNCNGDHKEIRVIAGADHACSGHDAEIAEMTGEWFLKWLKSGEENRKPEVPDKNIFSKIFAKIF